jgi:8-oxo-dGTP pyrophosphatase MutT (NUDIX family)
MKHEKSCGAIVINNGKVLVLTQNNGLHGFPKGHMELFEDERDTAIRETKEETNLDIDIYEDLRFPIKYTMKSGIKKKVIYFIGHPTSNNELKPQLKEVKEVNWIDEDKVLDFLEHDNIRDLYKKAIKQYKETIK